MIIKLTVPGLADSLVIPLENEIRELNKEIVDLNNDIDVLNAEHLELIDTLTDAINKQNETISAQEILIESLTTANTELSDKLNNAYPDGLKFSYSTFTNLPDSIKTYVESLSDLSYMFKNTYFNTDYLELDLPNATNLTEMFNGGGIKNIKIKTYNPISGDYLFNGTFETIDVGNLTIPCSGSLAYSCKQLKAVKGNITITKGGNHVFQDCPLLEEIPFIEFDCTAAKLIYGCDSLKYIPVLKTSKVTSFSSLIDGTYRPPIVRIEEIDCTNTWGFNFGIMSTIRYFLLKNLGGINFNQSKSNVPNWGIEDENEPLSKGARQSVIDSLITYSRDLSNMTYNGTFALSPNTKALLTDSEIALITAKGYTIA